MYIVLLYYMYIVLLYYMYIVLLYYMYIVLLYYLLSCKSILYTSDNKGMSSVAGNVNDCLVNK